MDDLYTKDCFAKLNNQVQELKKYINSCDIERIKKTIRNYTHLKMYQTHRQDNEVREA